MVYQFDPTTTRYMQTNPPNPPENTRRYSTSQPVSNTTKEEIGFAEFPITTTAKRRPPFDTLEFIERVGTDPQTREGLYRTWKMVASKQYGTASLTSELIMSNACVCTNL